MFKYFYYCINMWKLSKLSKWVVQKEPCWNFLSVEIWWRWSNNKTGCKSKHTTSSLNLLCAHLSCESKLIGIEKLEGPERRWMQKQESREEYEGKGRNGRRKGWIRGDEKILHKRSVLAYKRRDSWKKHLRRNLAKRGQPNFKGRLTAWIKNCE